MMVDGSRHLQNYTDCGLATTQQLQESLPSVPMSVSLIFSLTAEFMAKCARVHFCSSSYLVLALVRIPEVVHTH